MRLGILIEKPSPLMMIYVHEENAFVPSQYKLFGKDEIKALRTSNDLAFLEVELERSVMKRIPVDGQVCNDTASNLEIGLTECLDEVLFAKLGCRFPWGGGNDTAACEDDRFEQFSEALGWRYFWTAEDVFGTPCKPSCVTNNYRLATTLEKTAKCERSELCSKYDIARGSDF